MDKYADPMDDLVEHYARIIVEDGRAPDMPMARLMVDTARDFDGLLGRITETDVQKGFDPRYVRLRALVLAGIAGDSEKIEWGRLVDEHNSFGDLDLAEPDPRPMVSEEEMADLREHLWEIRRISAHEKDLKKAKEKHTQAVIPILKQVGSVMIADPIDGNPRVTNVIQAETLVVEAPALLEALVEHYGDEDVAYVVWKDTLKPPAVDTKDEGLFHQATKERIPGDPDSALVPPAVVAKVASFKKSAAYIGFSKPGG